MWLILPAIGLIAGLIALIMYSMYIWIFIIGIGIGILWLILSKCDGKTILSVSLYAVAIANIIILIKGC